MKLVAALALIGALSLPGTASAAHDYWMGCPLLSTIAPPEAVAMCGAWDNLAPRLRALQQNLNHTATNSCKNWTGEPDGGEGRLALFRAWKEADTAYLSAQRLAMNAERLAQGGPGTLSYITPILLNVSDTYVEGGDSVIAELKRVCPAAGEATEPTPSEKPKAKAKAKASPKPIKK